MPAAGNRLGDELGGVGMWLFFSRRLRMWLMLAVGVPVAAWLIGRSEERRVGKECA